MKKDEEIILNTDPGIVEWRSVKGWVGKDGRYYGKDDRAKEMAIYSNSTHQKCDEGHIYGRGWINCPECRKLSVPEAYKQLEFKPWDGNVPLCLYDDDRFFFDEDDLIDFMHDNDLTKDEIMLVICEPQYLHEVEEDYWAELFPEDWGLEDVSKEVADKFGELNEAIRKSRPASWWPSNKRTIYDFQPKSGAPM